MKPKRNTENEVVVSPTGAASARRKARVRPHVPATERETDPTTSIEASTANDQPDREKVAALAYSYWEQRGYQGGSPEEDWLRAEQELKVPVAAVTA